MRLKPFIVRLKSSKYVKLKQCIQKDVYLSNSCQQSVAVFVFSPPLSSFSATLFPWPGAHLAYLFPFFFLPKQPGWTLTGLLNSFYCCVTLTLFQRIKLPSKSYLSLSLTWVLEGVSLSGEMSAAWGRNSSGIAPHLQRCGPGTRRGELGRRSSEVKLM